MYSFERHGDALTLRPEGTAGAARAYVEHNVHAQGAGHALVLPRPDVPRRAAAEGRYRQFYQAGCEVFGDPGPACDAEMIDMLVGFLRELGIPRRRRSHVNSLGGAGTRARYRDALVALLRRRSATAQRRLAAAPRTKPAPHPRLQGPARRRRRGRAVDPRRARRRRPRALRRPAAATSTRSARRTSSTRTLVRGLDYYTRTLFEIRADGAELGAQNALGGGGRYDGMVEELGGPEVPGDRLRPRPRAAAPRDADPPTRTGDQMAASSRPSASRHGGGARLARELRGSASQPRSTAAAARSRACCGAPTRVGAHLCVDPRRRRARAGRGAGEGPRRATTQEELPLEADVARDPRRSRRIVGAPVRGGDERESDALARCSRHASSALSRLCLVAARARARAAEAGQAPAGSSSRPARALRSKPAPQGSRPRRRTPLRAPSDDAHAPRTQEPSLPPNPLEIPPEVREAHRHRRRRGRETGRGRARSSATSTAPTTREERRLQLQDRSSRSGSSASSRTIAHRSSAGSTTTGAAPSTTPTSSSRSSGTCATTRRTPRSSARSCTASASPSGAARARQLARAAVLRGQRRDGGGYLHIPPLLTFTQHTDDGGLQHRRAAVLQVEGRPVLRPAHRRRHRSAASRRSTSTARTSAASTSSSRRCSTTTATASSATRSFNLWGPLLWEHSRESDVFNIMPLFWHNWGKNEDHITRLSALPLRLRGQRSNLLVTPLFLTARGEKGEITFVTWGYARYRGRTELDMVTPLYWHYRDPDIGLDAHAALPVLLPVARRPRGDDTGVFPFYGHFKKPATSARRTWITPFFRHTHDLDGLGDEHLPVPLLGREQRDARTLVVAPFFWDFASPHSRTTVRLPAASGASPTTTRLAARRATPTITRRRCGGGTRLGVPLLPGLLVRRVARRALVERALRPRRLHARGPMTKVRALWVPIPLSSDPPRWTLGEGQEERNRKAGRREGSWFFF